ncbi:MAG: hypothetical protein CME71_08610 [Halobacteriovorax sp.]|nr:hypothetical protein [Halobacteriovorax sp.]
MQDSDLKAQYLELLQSAYLECVHEFGKFLDVEIYQDQIKGIRVRAQSHGIEPEAFDEWAHETLQGSYKPQRTWRKVS